MVNISKLAATVAHGDGWDELFYIRVTADGTEQVFNEEPTDHPELLVLRVFRTGDTEQTVTWNRLPVKQDGVGWISQPSAPPGRGWHLRKKCQRFSYWVRKGTDIAAKGKVS